VVMPGAEIEVAMERTERWREAFAAASSETLGPLLSCTVSIGVAGHRDTAKATLGRADAALYAAKRAGRNRVHRADEDDPSTAT
jgi:diguanylate cyclase (GGDEF)-like protein